MHDLPVQNWLDQIQQAHRAAPQLMQASAQSRNRALKSLIQTLQDQQDTILEANTLDLETSRDLAISSLGLQWLKLTPERLTLTQRFLEQLLQLPDPLQIGRGLNANLFLRQGGGGVMPLGVICGFYEYLPEFPVLLAGLCLKTGNSLVLKSSAATHHTHELLSEALSQALAAGKLADGTICCLKSDRLVNLKDLGLLSDHVDLLIPYGRPSFIKEVTAQAKVPTLSPAMGNCHLLWSASGSSDLVRAILIDSHRGLPDAVNAIETVLIAADIKRPLLTVLWNHLRENGFTLKGDAELFAEFPDLLLAEPEDWTQPSAPHKRISFKAVTSPTEGMQWINDHSSGHADCLVTESYREGQQFSMMVQSSSLFINTSPRFSRLTSGIDGTLALGMTQRTSHTSGPIGISSLVRSRYIFQGCGT